MSDRSKKLAESVLARMRARLAEEVEELDELSTEKLLAYRKKARAADTIKHDVWADTADEKIKKKTGSYNPNLLQRAKAKLAKEEAEQIDEVDASVLAAAGTLWPAAAYVGGKIGAHLARKVKKNTAIQNEKERKERAARITAAAEKRKAELAAMRREEAEQIDELSKGTLARYAIRAKNQLARSEFGAGREVGMRNMDGKGQGEMEKAYNRRADKRHQGLDMAIDKLAKEEAGVLDTALSDVKQSSRGEVYSKSTEKCSAPTKPTGTKTGVTAGKTGEAYNTTAATKRIAAVESAVADIMAKSMERRRIYNESANIAIISPEQRSDWMNVERGMMNVVDYFNKYRAGEE